MKKIIIIVIIVVLLGIFLVPLPFVDYVTYYKPGTDGNLISNPTLFQYLKYK